MYWLDKSFDGKGLLEECIWQRQWCLQPNTTLPSLLTTFGISTFLLHGIAFPNVSANIVINNIITFFILFWFHSLTIYHFGNVPTRVLRIFISRFQICQQSRVRFLIEPGSLFVISCFSSGHEVTDQVSYAVMSVFNVKYDTCENDNARNAKRDVCIRRPAWHSVNLSLYAICTLLRGATGLYLPAARFRARWQTPQPKNNSGIWIIEHKQPELFGLNWTLL